MSNGLHIKHAFLYTTYQHHQQNILLIHICMYVFRINRNKTSMVNTQPKYSLSNYLLHFTEQQNVSCKIASVDYLVMRKYPTSKDYTNL